MKPWTAKFLVAVAVLVPLAFFFGACASDPKAGGGPFGQSAAAWAQAMGSVGAICAAIYAANLPVIERQRERREAHVARASFVSDRVRRAANLCEILARRFDDASIRNEAIDELEEVAEFIKTFSTDTDHAVIATYAEFATRAASEAVRMARKGVAVRLQDASRTVVIFGRRAEALNSIADRLDALVTN